ncbi:MAG: transcription termination/antitermination factor NusG [Clostridiales bacterium]|nr:MAG: transcription termination/antitermination factor NusG [Clostridiales bacterium]
MSNEMAQWYVIHTYSGYENKVAANIQKMIEMRGLENLIFETRIPTEVLVESEQEADEYLKNAAFEDETESTEDDEDDAGSEKAKKRKKDQKPVEHKLFPSYVLIKMIMNDETWHIVRNIRGVTGFVGPGSKPVPLTEKEVEALGVEVRVRKPSYEVGDSVMVVAGFIAGSVATVNEINEATGRIKITANIGGRETVVEMAANEVEPLKS